MLGTRFNLIALSLEEYNLISSRMLAFAHIEYLPHIVKDITTNEMTKQDKARATNGEALTNRDELVRMAREEEARVLTLEAEFRAAGVRSLPEMGGADKNRLVLRPQCKIA